MGVLSFLAGTGMSKSEVQWLTVVTGILSLVSVAWQQMGKSRNYGARSEMHTKVFRSIDKLSSKMTFETDAKDISSMEDVVNNIQQGIATDGNDYDEASMNASVYETKKKHMKKHSELLRSYQAIFEQILESCPSPLPIQVSQAYRLLETRLDFGLRSGNTKNELKEVFTRSTHSYSYDDTFECIIYSAYSELFNQFTKYRRYPLFLPEASDAVENALKKVSEHFANKDRFFSSRRIMNANAEKYLLEKHFANSPLLQDMRVMISNRTRVEKQKEIDKLEEFVCKYEEQNKPASDNNKMIKSRGLSMLENEHDRAFSQVVEFPSSRNPQYDVNVTGPEELEPFRA